MDDTDPPPVVYTDRQREVIRTSLKEYYEFQRVGPRKASWGGICDEIFDYTGVRVRQTDVVRQWVKRFIQKGRKKPVEPNAEELNAIVSFLMHPDIDMLLPEELEDPEPPYRFLRSFLQFLRNDPSHDIWSPSKTLNGVYEAWQKIEEIDGDEEKWFKTILILEVDRERCILRAKERLEIHFRGADGGAVFSGDRDSEGWGIETPEGNLFLFMKEKLYAHRYYYVTIATDPGINPVVIRHLALLRHERPAIGDPTSKPLEELIRETEGGTFLLHFKKVEEPDIGGGA